ncbi:MAG: hypothetical protein H6718_07795 [Polyangiaceae bacterium]|nr:hypothetical protein [Polyangiaceae bacterium]MCB9606699.1 hypothetical protein [Polyangiaceae bacterium]
MTRSRVVLQALTLLVSSGCGSDPEAPEPARCEKTESTVALDEATFLGQTTEELLGPLLTDYDCSWSWQDPSPVATITAPANENSAHVAFAFADDHATLITAERIGPREQLSEPCESSLTVKVAVTIETSEGTLSASYPLNFTLQPGGTAYASLDLSDHEPSNYDITWSDGFTNHRHILDVWMAPDSAVGIISVYGDRDDTRYSEFTGGFTCPKL